MDLQKKIKKAFPLILSALLYSCASGGGSQSTSSAVILCTPQTWPEEALNDPLLGGSTGNSEVDSFINLANNHRASIGRVKLKWNSQLALIAQNHAQDMIDNNYFSHTSLSGKTPTDRVNDQGVDFSAISENIASGQMDANTVLNDWLNSPPHKTTLEDSDSKGYLYHGAAFIQSGSQSRWVHFFARPPCL